MGRLGALLCPTWQSHAGLPPEEGACVTFYAVRLLERGGMAMGDFGALALQQPSRRPVFTTD